MAYCINCGVEVDSAVVNCPLCLSSIQKNGELIDKDIQDYPQEVESLLETKMDRKQKRLVAWEIVSVSLAVPFLIVMIINIIIDHNARLVWAKFPMAALFLAWALATFPLFLSDRPILIVVGEVLSLMVFLTLIDLFDNWTFDWLYRLAFPIIGLTSIIVSLVVLISMKSKKKGFNTAAYVLFGIALLNLGLDLTIVSFLAGELALAWSLYVAIPLTLVGGFLLYVHYRIARVVDLQKVAGIRKRLRI
ncbi:MAG: hypothetical protein GOP50_11635 [Candidatus Heimdallarchaeota archaeon]|nr:hypothetical protein [Candidatus Heimdallarchaeota archaeon]